MRIKRILERTKVIHTTVSFLFLQNVVYDRDRLFSRCYFEDF